MRLWPICILDQLPRQQLLGQHRECCALRGAGWGKKHRVVDYVFTHPYSWLYAYHLSVIGEMAKRGYRVDDKWLEIRYRGRAIGYDWTGFADIPDSVGQPTTISVYPEHNREYLLECVGNLAAKGVAIDRGLCEAKWRKNGEFE